MSTSLVGDIDDRFNCHKSLCLEESAAVIVPAASEIIIFSLQPLHNLRK